MNIESLAGQTASGSYSLAAETKTGTTTDAKGAETSSEAAAVVSLSDAIESKRAAGAQLLAAVPEPDSQELIDYLLVKKAIAKRKGKDDDQTLAGFFSEDDEEDDQLALLQDVAAAVPDEDGRNEGLAMILQEQELGEFDRNLAGSVLGQDPARPAPRSAARSEGRTEQAAAGHTVQTSAKQAAAYAKVASLGQGSFHTTT